MRLRQARKSEIPEVNLVPMMDVMMSVITFFVISSITMTGERIAGVDLPGTDVEGQGTQAIPAEVEKLIVGLNDQQQILINNVEFTQDELVAEMESFLQTSPNGIVVLSAHRSLEYKQIEALLQVMGAVGGERVSLALQPDRPE